MIVRLTLLFFLFSCASTSPLPRNALIDEILSVRPGKHVLSNTATVTCGKTKCLETKEYDLQDPVIRKILFEFQFVCRIGEKRYNIAMDRPGFYRNVCHSGFLWRRKCDETYLDIEKDYAFIVDGRTVCFSQLRRDWDEVD